MIRVYRGEALSEASAETDPYVSLTIRWGSNSSAPVLNLFVRDPIQGYIELTADAQTGELLSLVVIDEPRSTDRRPTDVDIRHKDRAVVLDRGLWKWKVTPDYREPIQSGADVTQPMSVSLDDAAVTIWFSHHPVSEIYLCGSVAIGVAADDELVCVSVTDSKLAAEIQAHKTTEWLS